MSRAGLLLATLLGFALRLHALAAVPLRWDEGWSIALSKLPLPEIMRLTALDVHPPLYYFSLVPWTAVGGTSEFWTRALSALVATLAVPMAAAAAHEWWGSTGAASRRAGLLAAFFAATAPALVYYSGVTRMYAMTAPLLLLAMWGLARYASGGRARHALASGAGAAGALYVFYYTGFALVGLFAAALLAWPRAWRRTLLVALLSALAFMPWVFYAAPLMLQRVGERTGASGIDPMSVLRLTDDAMLAAVFLERLQAPAVTVTLLVLVAGSLVARPRMGRLLAVVVLPVAATLIGAALGAQAHMFAPRYAIGATPFLVVGLGWAVAGLWGRSRALGVLGAAAILLAAAPTLTDYVYARAAEVTGDYDPSAIERQLAQHSQVQDMVAFNILSLAGAYERHRAADDPPWTYGQVWDPVREPAELAIARVRSDLDHRPRLWLVLYRGTASPGSAALKEWADTALFPTDGWWTDDGTLVQGYVNATPDTLVSPDVVFAPAAQTSDEGRSSSAPSGDVGDLHGASEGGARLVKAAFSSSAHPGAGIAVDLTWRAEGKPARDARVYVHAYDASGALVAQHDGYPAYDTRPPTTWAPSEVIRDRHGLSLPPDATGELTIVVGLYDPQSGQRWLLADGSDGVELGQVTVR